MDDRLDKAGDDRLVAWVKAGGTLVAADNALVANFTAPAEQPGPEGLVTDSGSFPIDCQNNALAGVESIDPAGGFSLRLPRGATGCFHSPDGGSFVVIDTMGKGNVVLLGGPDLWTNQYLGHDDNSVLAVNLLAPNPEGPPVQWIVGPVAGGGTKSLSQLVPGRVKEALALLVVALLVVGLWRARRLGRPVVETPPVELPGSELVVAVGHLLQQGGRLDDASGILRASLRRGIVERLGVPPTAPTDAMAAVVSSRTGLDPGMVQATVAGPVPTTDAELVALAANADLIQQGMAHAR